MIKTNVYLDWKSINPYLLIYKFWVSFFLPVRFFCVNELKGMTLNLPFLLLLDTFIMVEKIWKLILYGWNCNFILVYLFSIFCRVIGINERNEILKMY